MPSARLAAAAALTLAMLIAPAAARADVEPNNGLLQAEGPLVGGQTYAGTAGTSNDRDWYVFYANSQVELDLTFTTPDDCDGSASLYNGDGGYIDEAYIAEDFVSHIRYTTPIGVNRFYVSVYCDTAQHYELTVNPATGLTTGPSPFGMPTPLGEPNESRAQAIGPLAGGVDYEGVQGTDNDADWFYFYVAGPRALDIATTSRDDCDGSLTLYNSRGSSVGESYPSLNGIGHITYTAPAGVTKMFISAGCDTTRHYQFRIDPADAVVAAPPPPPVTSPACFKAKARRAFYQNRIRRLKQKMVRTTSVRRYRRYRRNLRAARIKLKRAQTTIRFACP
jgi:hypothetical protein